MSRYPWLSLALLGAAFLSSCGIGDLARAPGRSSSSTAPAPGHSSQAEVIEAIRPVRIPEVRPGVIATSPTTQPTAQPTTTARSTAAAQPTVTAQPSAAASAEMRLGVYCVARTESLRMLAISLHQRMNEVPVRLQDGDIASAQADYDVARWAASDFGSSIAEVVEHCESIAPRLTGQLQSAASQLSTAWSATRGACVSDYSHHGIECD